MRFFSIPLGLGIGREMQNVLSLSLSFRGKLRRSMEHVNFSNTVKLQAESTLV